MPVAIQRVAVIGAGISGVNTAAHLLAEGLHVTVFERAPITGGVWVWSPELPFEPTYPSAPPSVAETTFHHGAGAAGDHRVHSSPGPAYEDLKNNVPTELLQVSLNQWKANTESFANHAVLAAYIQDTAVKAGVQEHTLFDTKVVLVKKEQGQWQVVTQTWSEATKQSTRRDWTFDAVVVASGHYHAPFVPDIPRLAEWKRALPANVQHAKSFRNNKGFQDKTVLLIGGSASSTDIAVSLSPVVHKIWQSTRNGAFDHPPTMLPDNATRVGPIARFDKLPGDIPAPYASAAPDPSPFPATVTLADGQVLRDIDRVIVATGYQFSLPFLPEYHRDSVAPQDADSRVLVTDGLQLHNLHKDIFYIPDPTLAFVGVPFYTATISLFEFQAIAVAAVFSGKTILPPEAAQRAEYDQRVRDKGYGKVFHSLWSHDADYAEELMAWVNEGRAPDERKPDGYSAEWKTFKEEAKKIANVKNVLYEEHQAV